MGEEMPNEAVVGVDADLQARHKAALRSLNRALIASRNGEIDDDDRNVLHGILSSVVDFTDAQLSNHFSKAAGRGGFLNKEEFKVFRSLKATLTRADSAVHAMSDRHGIEDVNRDLLVELFVKRVKANADLFTDDYRIVLTHIQDNETPKVLIERLGAMSMYFSHGAYAEDCAKPENQAKIEALKSAIAAADSEPKRIAAEKAFAAEVKRLAMARIVPIQVETSGNVDACRVRDDRSPEHAVMKNGLVPPGYVDCVMIVPGGFAVGFMTTADFDREASVEQISSHLNKLCGGIQLGFGKSIDSVGKILAIDVFSLVGNQSEKGFERHESLSAKGLNLEYGRFLRAASGVFRANNTIPLELAERISFNGILCKGIQRENLAYTKIGDVIAKEFEALTSPEGLALIETNADVAVHARRMMEALRSPSQLGITEPQKTSLSSSLSRLVGTAADDQILDDTRGSLEQHSPSIHNKAFVEKKVEGCDRARGRQFSEVSKLRGIQEEFKAACAQQGATIEGIVAKRSSSPTKQMSPVEWCLYRGCFEDIDPKLKEKDEALTKRWSGLRASQKVPGELANIADELFERRILLQPSPVFAQAQREDAPTSQASAVRVAVRKTFGLPPDKPKGSRKGDEER